MKKTAPIAFAGCELAESRHVCAFFNSDEEAYRVLLPFIAEGFRCNHKAVHMINPGEDLAHRRRLRDCGVDLAGAGAAGPPHAARDVVMETSADLQRCINDLIS